MKTILKKSVLVLVLVTVAGISTAFYAYRDREFEIVKNLDIFYTLFKELNMFYVDETNPEQLIKKGIDGMLGSLDPYTEFIPESEADDFRFQTTGEYGGIGALIRKAGDYAVVSDPYEGFPAAKNGIQAGDLLLEIDGTSTKKKELPKVSELLKGTPGTEVTLLIRRGADGKELKKKLKREKITIPNVPYAGMLDNHTGYIRLSSFTTNAGKEVRDAMANLRDKKGAQAIILDLRGNPGGLLMEAVNIAAVFIPRGKEVVSTKGKVNQFDFDYKTSLAPVDTTIPVVVLTSRGSASASEIVAGSLQDYDRAVILGQRTFGKGLVQTTRRLSYNTQLKVTTAKYYIPSGRCIQAVDYSHRNEDGSVGIIPDSLIHAFKTKNGRTVYDGGGILPDVKEEPENFSRIAVSLVTRNILFDFATRYAGKHDSIPQPGHFSLTDQEYAEFVEFIKDKDFDYQTESESKLAELEKAARNDKYFEQVKDELKALSASLAHDENKDIQTFRPEIEQLLTEEIVSRYYYQGGRIAYSLRFDNQVQAAKKILQDKAKYTAILNGSYKPSGEQPGVEIARE
ncbi:MAG: S41 family peptidase [Bacteroidales bacterium]